MRYFEVPGDAMPNAAMGDDQHGAGMSQGGSQSSRHPIGEVIIALSTGWIADSEIDLVPGASLPFAQMPFSEFFDLNDWRFNNLINDLSSLTRSDHWTHT